MGWANWPDYFSKVSKCPHHHREVFHVIDWKGLYTSIAFDCPIITKLTIGRLLKCKYTRELTKIYNIMYNIYGIHLAFISFIYVTGMGSIAFSVEQIGDVLEKKNNNNNNFFCIAAYTKALYRFTIKKKKITNNSTKTKSQLKVSLKR